ncbi:MAG: hypothetical protein WBL51_04960 [Acidimicrobiales bacterium]
MKIEWSTFVRSVEGEDDSMVIHGPGMDSVLAKWLPVDVEIWMTVCLRTDFREFEDPTDNVLRAEIKEPQERELVGWWTWTMGAPRIASDLYQEGHSGHQVKAFLLKFHAETEGWYDVELSVNGGEIYLCHLRVAPKPESFQTQ